LFDGIVEASCKFKIHRVDAGFEPLQGEVYLLQWLGDNLPNELRNAFLKKLRTMEATLFVPLAGSRVVMGT